MPFQTCGTGARLPPAASKREARTDLPLRYTATMEATSQALRILDDEVKVYERHHVVGGVTEVVRGESTVFVEFRVRPEYARQAVDMVLQLYRSRENHDRGWFAAIDPSSPAAPGAPEMRRTAMGG